MNVYKYEEEVQTSFFERLHTTRDDVIDFPTQCSSPEAKVKQKKCLRLVEGNGEKKLDETSAND